MDKDQYLLTSSSADICGLEPSTNVLTAKSLGEVEVSLMDTSKWLLLNLQYNFKLIFHLFSFRYCSEIRIQAYLCSCLCCWSRFHPLCYQQRKQMGSPNWCRLYYWSETLGFWPKQYSYHWGTVHLLYYTLVFRTSSLKPIFLNTSKSWKSLRTALISTSNH